MSRATLLATVLVTLMSMATLAKAEIAGVKTYLTQGDYAQVKQDLEDAIVDAGLKIDYRGNIGDMLARTGKDVGSTKAVYRRAEFMQFCSARLSRKAMEADAANMSICPYVIYLFEPAATPGQITVGYKRPSGAAGEASQKAVSAIDKLLDGIVKEAAGQ